MVAWSPNTVMPPFPLPDQDRTVAHAVGRVKQGARVRVQPELPHWDQ
jgi:hypothetical protein